MAAPKNNDPMDTALSPAEWDVMRVLWTQGDMASRDVVAALTAERDWSPSTVKTLLGRLVAKGAVDYVQVGNSYLYRAVLAQADAQRTETERFVERVHAGHSFAAVAQLIEAAAVSKDELARLRELLDEKERTQRRRR
jgi:BlaI family penicillinase repressor